MTDRPKKTLKKLMAILLTLITATSIFSVMIYAAGAVLGDINLDGKVNSTDALLALQQAVSKVSLPYKKMALANVNNDFSVNATDALLILQFAVGKISAFPKSRTEKELYYDSRDFYYHSDGKDFETRTVTDINDTEALLDEYGTVAEPSDVEVTRLDSSDMLIYDRVKKEAEELGTLDKYKKSEKATGTLTLGKTTLKYSMPTDITAYDAVPVDYEIVSGEKIMPIHLGVTAFEETSRYAEQDKPYFDCNLPGKVDIELTYLGYSNAQNVSSRSPKWRADFNDTKGTAYPEYEMINDQPVYSGTVAAKKKTWFKFRFKNTGNTILDSEGNGAFCFHPILQKKNASGEYVEVAKIDNYMQRLYDYVYPGETGEFWLIFQDSYATVPAGDYRIVIYSQVRNERDPVGWAANYVGGRTVCTDMFYFSATKDGEITEPLPISHENVGIIPRNNWLSVYEEFMSSYATFKKVSSDESAPTKGTLYIQPAPFTETVVIKLMQANRQSSTMVRIPVNVETDSISIELNPYNDNYYVKEDGTREPLLATQSMVDMRGNAQMGPDAMSTVINDLKNMQEAGINMLTSTCAFSYDPRNFDSFKFMMDTVRTMGGFTFAAYASYPSNSQLTINNATYANGGNFEKTMTPWGIAGYNEANAIMAKYSYTRFGDMFFRGINNSLPIALEDTWGWMTVDHDWRFGMVNDEAISQYRDFIKKAYSGDINKLNKKYGSDFTSFDEIDPRTDGVYEPGMEAYNFTDKNGAVYKDWSNATMELDVYRTLARIDNYKKILAQCGITDAKIAIRSEGATWLAGGIKADTKNAHYRQVYYEQRRNAIIPEILSSSGLIYGCSNYGDLAPSPKETYELTRHSTDLGLTMLKMSSMVHQRDMCINTTYGDSKYVSDYNLKNKNLKGACVDVMSPAFPYLKAMYEGGGIPGIMWQDYYCDLFVTSTQYKELKFYTQKIKKMLSTEEGQKWATDFDKKTTDYTSDVKATWSYEKDYVKNAVNNTPRFCNFTDSYKPE